MKNKLIVIDGLDGSGKSTQLELTGRLLSEKYAVKSVSFPEYDKPSSALVKMYLNGDISANAEDVNAYAASSFYAVDRYASYKIYWEENYKRGDIILAGRYVSSNAIHQMSKLPENEWDEYINWLEDYEYGKLSLPRPDMVIFLDMPVDISQRLMTARYNGDDGKKDIHEANVSYLMSCRRTALYAAERCGWNVIECSSGGEPLPVETITRKIMDKINSIL